MHTRRGLAFTPDSAYRTLRTAPASLLWASRERAPRETVRCAAIWIGLALILLGLIAGVAS